MRNMRVWVVSADSSVATDLRSALRPRGAQVAGFTIPGLVLAALQLGRPDALLLDLGMPYVDGLGLAEKIRARPNGRTVPIFLTGTEPGARDRIRASQVGVEGFVSPAEAAEVLLAALPGGAQPALASR